MTDGLDGPPPVAPEAEAERHIGYIGAVLIVVGNIIGSAIFLTSGTMLKYLFTGGELILVWVVGGMLSLFGGLTYAELGAMHPRSGGLYVYLSEAFGARVAFLFGWSSVAIILTGQIAGLAVAFADYLSYFIPTLSLTHGVWALRAFGVELLAVSAGKIVAVSLIAVLVWLNMRNLRGSRDTAIYLALLVVSVLIGLIGIAFATTSHLTDVDWAVDVHPGHVQALATAMVPVLYAYEGWAYLAFAASEVKRPETSIPRALALGIGIATCLYVLTNLAYLSALPASSLRGVERVAEAAATASAGTAGAAGICAAAIVSTLCNCAVTVFVAARILFAMAKRGAVFKSCGRLHPTRRTPDRAVLLIGVWSAALAVSGTYEQLYTLVMFAVLLFAVAGGAAIFVLRSTQSEKPRPYRVHGYPWVPAVFVAAMAGLAVNTGLKAPVQAVAGLVLVAAGWPLYTLIQRKAVGPSCGESCSARDRLRRHKTMKLTRDARWRS